MKVNTQNDELLTALAILFRSHHVVKDKSRSCFDSDDLKERMVVIDPARIEEVYPVRFRRKVLFEYRYIEELVRFGLCVLEVFDEHDDSIHYFACGGVSGDDVLITDYKGETFKLGKRWKGINILWFDKLDWISENAPKDAIAIVSKAVSFLGTVDEPLHSNRVIFNYDFRAGDPIKENDWWCTSFVWDVFRMCGLSHLLCNGRKVQNAIDILEWGRESGLMVDLTDMRYGDILVYNWDGTGSADHTAICVEIKPDNRILTIDGCTGELDDHSGGHVNFRCRRIEAEEILGVIRPAYK